MLVGVASALLASALTVRTVARRQSARDAVAARALTDLLGTLAARSCQSVDTAEVSVRETAAGPAMVSWHARRSGAGWAFAESVSLNAGIAAGASAVTTEGRVPCT